MTDWVTYWATNWPKKWLNDWVSDQLTHWPSDWPIDRPTGSPTDWVNCLAEWPTDCLTDRLMKDRPYKKHLLTHAIHSRILSYMQFYYRVCKAPPLLLILSQNSPIQFGFRNEQVWKSNLLPTKSTFCLHFSVAVSYILIKDYPDNHKKKFLLAVFKLNAELISNKLKKKIYDGNFAEVEVFYYTAPCPFGPLNCSNGSFSPSTAPYPAFGALGSWNVQPVRDAN